MAHCLAVLHEPFPPGDLYSITQTLTFTLPHNPLTAGGSSGRARIVSIA